ncbi:MAG TPA: hypothetical protein LFV91_04905, partial [Rickettsia endosymbiont of Bembidion nr. Transversale]|nr:hypothetical protein [Rickettsia endosymbiont of Bembidion nr. Transversale]
KSKWQEHINVYTNFLTPYNFSCYLLMLSKSHHLIALSYTISNSSSHCNNPPSIIEDQRNIKNLLNILMEVIYDRKNRLNADLENIQFEYFHSHNDEFQQIVSSSIIPETDPRFLKCNNDYTDNRIFCASSSFFKGCIRIS